MKFFDYIFYRVCLAYSNTKDSPEFTAVCTVAATQCFAFLDFFMLVAMFKQDKSVLNLPIVIVVAISLLVFNYIRYIHRANVNYATLKERWKNESKKFEKGIAVLVFIIVSTGIFFGLAIYLGSKKW
jgi:hypothetical protein